MPDMWMNVDAALSEVPVNIMPLVDDTLTVPIVVTIAAAILGTLLGTNAFRYEHCAASFARFRFWTAAPSRIVFASKMMGRVFRLRHQLQVLKMVIGLVSVLVMNMLVAGQCSAKMGAHYQPMFSDIANVAFFQSVRVVWPKDVNVTISGNESAAFPIRVEAAFRPVASDKADILAVLESVQSGSTWSKCLTASTTAFDGFSHTGILLKTIEKRKP